MLNFEQALVTGGAGFIGSHITDRLIREDCQVRILDDLSTGTRANLSDHRRGTHLHFLHSSILDTANLSRAMKGVERVFHEAAIVSSEFANQKPVETSQINVQGTLNVLDAARKNDVGHLTYASSAAVYGDCKELPISEEAPTKPLSPYGASKLAGELFVLAYYRTYGLKTTSLRYFNVYGPRQTQNPYSGVITVFLKRLDTGKALEIQGDGEQSRDFIYVTDVAEANIKAASTKSAAGKILNIATGKPKSISELAEQLGSILKVHPAKRMLPPRLGDIRHSYADTRRAEELLNFKAKISFRGGLQRYADWLKRT